MISRQVVTPGRISFLKHRLLRYFVFAPILGLIAIAAGVAIEVLLRTS